MSPLEEKIRQLPPDAQRQVEQFVESLLSKNVPKQGQLRLSWAGGLREFRDRFTSLELQKKALEWWGD
jgi:hypothetical protein